MVQKMEKMSCYKKKKPGRNDIESYSETLIFLILLWSKYLFY